MLLSSRLAAQSGKVVPAPPKTSSPERLLFGRRVREERKARDWTLEDLSYHTGLAWNYIADVERGERNVTLDTASKISAGLEVPLWQLLRPAKMGLSGTDEPS